MRMVKRISINWKYWFVCIIFFMIPCMCYAQNEFENVYIGDVQKGEEILINKEDSYPLYKVKEQIYVSLAALQDIGFSIKEHADIYYIEREAISQKQLNQVHEIMGKAYMNPKPVYCGNIRSYALRVEDDLLIPIEVLKGLCQVEYLEESYWLEDSVQNPLLLLKMDEEGITNMTDHIMQLTCSHLYWNGYAYEKVEEHLFLEAEAQTKWTLSCDKLYITTWVIDINEWQVPGLDETIYGQYKEAIFRQYSESIYLRQLTAVFPEYSIQAQMLYTVGSLKEKEIVDVCRSERRSYYWVKNKNGDKFQVPYGSIRIIGEKGVRLNKVNQKEIEDFATLSRIESTTDYLLWTDIYRQRTYVLKKQDGKWKLEQKFVCSTGKLNNPTPTGLYEVQYSIPYIGVEKGYRCKYALVFFRDYMYHSILFDRSGKYIKSGQYELGSKASHGCIRLSEKDSGWLYAHVPVKSTVWVR